MSTTKTKSAGKGQAFTIDELRQVLSDGIRELRDGDTSAANINALSNATGKILSTVKLEMEYYKLTGRTPQIDMITAGRPLAKSQAAEQLNGVAAA